MKIKIIRMDVNVISLEKVVEVVSGWVKKKQSKYICVSNVHMCMESFDEISFRLIVNKADLTVPDGKPLYWAQKFLGYKHGDQIRGYDLALRLCDLSEKKGYKVGLIGGSSRQLLDQLIKNLKIMFPLIDIVFYESPPFRPITEEEDLEYIDKINSTSVDILFVGLGCPKQEIWMSEHKELITCTMVGVGAVFDFISGAKSEAPLWIQNIGMEWLYRFFSEPRRLWKRYLKQNPRFVYYLALQLLGKKYE